MKTIMRLANVDKSFGGVHAIDSLSFDIYEGEILGLIGPNGAGKSTCVNLIAGVYQQDSGGINFNGMPLLRQSMPDRALMGIGRTFQSPKPFEGLSIRDNVFTAALIYNKSMKDAEKATDEILELTDFAPIRDMPSSKLPIEKRKWLDMARVLAIRPRLLMLDECLAGLTPSEMEESLALVRRINATGVTILFIEHVMMAVTKLCTRVVVLNEGAFLSQGAPAVVMREEAVIKAYLGEEYKNVED
ncbi:MAG: ABC transporter ATP-binding protein [Planctomycetota bacterium]|jgi:ABC-type branched-subunit amino acid transport system ATPase component|nr:ABC transporter ATP-binding protein [Planctomycetota bacterium]